MAVLPEPSLALTDLERRAPADADALRAAVALRAQRIRTLISSAGRDDIASIAIQIAEKGDGSEWAAWPVSAHPRNGGALRAAMAANAATWRPLVQECRAVAALVRGDEPARLLLLDLDHGRVR